VKTVKLAFARFYDGFTFEEGLRQILPDLLSDYCFVESEQPEVVIFGPYGGALPAGRYVRVFYGCENVQPNMSACDWAFGVRYEEYVRHPRYTRLQWGDDGPLVKNALHPEDVLGRKTRFCNFVYSNPVPLREAFFEALSKYKQVDAPGASMNNMPPIDNGSGSAGWQEEKIRFLEQYKFTIAFENASFPGYSTEKIRHPMLASSIPIYWGDPLVHREFNPRSFINAHDLLRRLPRLKTSGTRTLWNRSMWRLNRELGRIEERLIRSAGFEALIELVVRLDQDDELYCRYLTEPWLQRNRPPDRDRYVGQWKKIFG
jgi:alpha(1,3/1,4) fucosyltransferase